MEGQTGARKRQDVTVGFKVKFDEDQMPVNGCLVISVFKAKEDLLANTHTHPGLLYCRFRIITGTMDQVCVCACV